MMFAILLSDATDRINLRCTYTLFELSYEPYIYVYLSYYIMHFQKLFVLLYCTVPIFICHIILYYKYSKIACVTVLYYTVPYRTRV